MIDRLVLLSGGVARFAGSVIRPIQNGIAQSYALVFSLGTVLVLLYTFWL